MNIRNHFELIGRLSQDPKVFDNKDGSKKVRLTLACKDNFTAKNGERKAQFVPCEAFLSADAVNKNGLGAYANMHQGDLVAVSGQIQNNNYVDKDGAQHYDLVLHIETREMMEPKSVTDQRLLARASAGGDATAAADGDGPVE